MRIFSSTNGSHLIEGYPFTLKGILYPANWLSVANAKEMRAIGVQETKVDERASIITGPDATGAFTVSPKDVVTIQTQFVGSIKQQASDIILAAFPDWKQRNMTARAVELLSKMIDGTISESEQAEVGALRRAWGWISSVRQQSNVLEAEVGALDVLGLASWVDHDWPAPL